MEVCMTPYFVMSKSKIAPLKKTCIPRIEQYGAVLLVTLTNFVFMLMSKNVTFSNVYAWRDTKVVPMTSFTFSSLGEFSGRYRCIYTR